MQKTEKNAKKLEKYFKDLGSALIAYSGGVDSSVLAKTAYDALGKKAVAATIYSPTMDKTELAVARKVAKTIGIKHVILKYDPLKDPSFRTNGPDRCYHCKKNMIRFLKAYAKDMSYNDVIEGTNAEEILGHRPGYRAVKEEGARSPLAELNLNKKDVRKLAHYLDLPNAEKPPTACLASRIPYGTMITKEALEKVAKAEKEVRSAGLKQVRVRLFGDVAVIEVEPEDMGKIIEKKHRINSKLRKLGFKRITLDLEGYASGRMNV